MIIPLNAQVRVTPKKGPPVVGILLEQDEQNIVIETWPSYEEVFRVVNVDRVELAEEARRTIIHQQPGPRVMIRRKIK